LGAFVSKNSTGSFFPLEVARTALQGRYGTSFVDRNQKFENAPNMSFGSNGVDWVRSFRKIELQVFLLQKWPEVPLGADFTRVLSTETESAKTHKTEFWVIQSQLGVFVLKNSTGSFFAAEVVRTALGAGFARVLSTETESAKTHQTRVLGQTRWIGCVRFEKFNCKFFLLQKWTERPSWAGFARVLSAESESAKTHQT
jgi:hypothetical protein